MLRRDYLKVRVFILKLWGLISTHCNYVDKLFESPAPYWAPLPSLFAVLASFSLLYTPRSLLPQDLHTWLPVPGLLYSLLFIFLSQLQCLPFRETFLNTLPPTHSRPSLMPFQSILGFWSDLLTICSDFHACVLVCLTVNLFSMSYFLIYMRIIIDFPTLEQHQAPGRRLINSS